MVRAYRSSVTASGTGSGRRLAAAPSTGSKRKAPTRSSCASSSQSRRYWESASVSPGEAAERGGAPPSARPEAEGADAVELRFVEPVEEILEIRLRLAGEADDEGGSD